VIDLDPDADRGGDRPQVVFVGADHQVAAAERSFHDRCVDYIGCPSPGGEGAGRPGLAVVEPLDVTSGQQPRQQDLTAGSAPGLGDDRRGDRRYLAAEHEPQESRARMSSASRVAPKTLPSSMTLEKSLAFLAFSAMTFSSIVSLATRR
jgi:hypothetical protein